MHLQVGSSLLRSTLFSDVPWKAILSLLLFLGPPFLLLSSKLTLLSLHARIAFFSVCIGSLFFYFLPEQKEATPFLHLPLETFFTAGLLLACSELASFLTLEMAFSFSLETELEASRISTFTACFVGLIFFLQGTPHTLLLHALSVLENTSVTQADTSSIYMQTARLWVACIGFALSSSTPFLLLRMLTDLNFALLERNMDQGNTFQHVLKPAKNFTLLVFASQFFSYIEAFVRSKS